MGGLPERCHHRVTTAAPAFRCLGRTVKCKSGRVKRGIPQCDGRYLRPAAGAVSLLDSLKGKVKLGIITNGFTALQQIRLERTGLRDHFDALVISEEVGVPKPDPRIFDYALAQAATPIATVC